MLPILTLWQLHALRRADHRHERLLACAGEEIVEADAEDERNPQQRRQRRKRRPLSSFESKAGDNPECCPSSTSPIFFFSRKARIFAPIA